MSLSWHAVSTLARRLDVRHASCLLGTWFKLSAVQGLHERVRHTASYRVATNQRSGGLPVMEMFVEARAATIDQDGAPTAQKVALQDEVRRRLAARDALGLRAEAPGRSLHVLHVIMRLSPADGGPPEMLRQLAANYYAIGDTLEVVTLDDPKADYLEKCKFPVHALGPQTGSYGLSRPLLRWLEANVSRFDLVVINSVWLFPAVAAWRAAKKAKVPFVVFTHGALDVFFKRRYPLKHMKKMVYWPLQYRILKDAAAVLFTSDLERELALESFRPNGWTSVVVPYGTNRPEGEPAMQAEAFYAQVPALRERRFVLFLSRIHEKKGCDMLVDAFAAVAEEYPDVDLVIAGPDQSGLQAGLQERAAQAGLSNRVVWPGMLQGPAKYGAFRAAEAFCLPSHQENFGIVVAEALACGTPVLISNQVNIWQEIEESAVGLVEADTVAGTEQLLRRWLQMPDEQRKTMVEACEGTFEKRFSLRRSAESIHVLAELLQAKRHSAA
jgi:glycosyltransferase involved in cell wall biosynthesis